MDHRQSVRPLSVKEIAVKAVNFEYNALIPLRFWLRTAETVHKEVTFLLRAISLNANLNQSAIYLTEGDEQQAYLLLLRWVE
jgi:STAM-binding protein